MVHLVTLDMDICIAFMKELNSLGLKKSAILNITVQILYITNQIACANQNIKLIQKTKIPILTYKKGLLSSLKRHLEIEGFDKNDVIQLVSKLPDSGRVSVNTLLKITHYLKKLGIKEKNIIRMFLNYPRLALCYKPTLINKKLGYILKVKRLPFSMIMNNPVILSYSINRIVPRLEFVESKAPHLLKQQSLLFWIKPNDEEFVKGCLCIGSFHEYVSLLKQEVSLKLSS